MSDKMREMCLELLVFRGKYKEAKDEFEELLEAWLKLHKGLDTRLINWDIEATEGKVFIVVDYECLGAKRFADFESLSFEEFFGVNWIKKLADKQDKKKAKENTKSVVLQAIRSELIN